MQSLIKNSRSLMTFLKQALNQNHSAAQPRPEPSPDLFTEAAPAPLPTFQDLMGMESTKACLLRAVESFRAHGGNGILLVGESGSAMAFIAQALAGELGLRFQTLRLHKALLECKGETEQKILAAFQEAQRQAPTLLFLDELDSVMCNSGNTGQGATAKQECKHAVFALLAAVSDLNPNYAQHQVLLLAATQHPDQLDPALTRTGRFDRLIELPAPDQPLGAALAARPGAGENPHPALPQRAPLP